MSIAKKYQLNSVLEMQSLAKKIARQILKTKPKTAIILALRGELGAGKTTFVQGLAKGLGVKEQVTSPTFVIMKRFKIYDLGFKNFYHIDCYRLQKPEDLLALEFQNIVANPRNIVAIEWADKIRAILPKQTFWFFFQHESKNTKNTRLLLTNF